MPTHHRTNVVVAPWWAVATYVLLWAIIWIVYIAFEVVAFVVALVLLGIRGLVRLVNRCVRSIHE